MTTRRARPESRLSRPVGVRRCAARRDPPSLDPPSPDPSGKPLRKCACAVSPEPLPVTGMLRGGVGGSRVEPRDVSADFQAHLDDAQGCLGLSGRGNP